MAHLIENTEYIGGTESLVDGLGTFLLVVGVIGCFGGMFIAVDAPRGSGALWISLALASLVQGIAAKILGMWLADVTRLLRKAAGLKYAGRMRDLREEHNFVCSECNREMLDRHDKCPWCNETFD